MISDEENTSAQKEFPVRTFRFNGHTLHADSRQRETLDIDYQTIFLIIRGTGIKQETSTETTTEQKFDIGKAILTGGLIMSKTVKTTEQKNNRRTGRVSFRLCRRGPAACISRRGAGL